MDIYIAIVLEEEISMNSSWVKVFKTLDEAKKWADNEIDELALNYGGNVMERADMHYFMEADDEYATIDIEKHTI